MIVCWASRSSDFGLDQQDGTSISSLAADAHKKKTRQRNLSRIIMDFSVRAEEFKWLFVYGWEGGK